MIKILVSIAALVVASGACRAENAAAARSCVGIADKEARLACFDAAYAPQTSRAPAAADTARFGDDGQLPPEKAVQANVPNRLNALVAAVSQHADGLYRLTLDNGQVWDTRQANRAVDFKRGDTVTIQRSLGGYQVSQAGSGRSVGAKRIQ